jgi:hypothetical protein
LYSGVIIGVERYKMEQEEYGMLEFLGGICAISWILSIILELYVHHLGQIGLGFFFITSLLAFVLFPVVGFLNINKKWREMKERENKVKHE